MSDGSCGPSNALASLQKHAFTDRTLQQDRVVHQGPTLQSFRPLDAYDDDLLKFDRQNVLPLASFQPQAPSSTPNKSSSVSLTNLPPDTWRTPSEYRHWLTSRSKDANSFTGTHSNGYQLVDEFNSMRLSGQTPRISIQQFQTLQQDQNSDGLIHVQASRAQHDYNGDAQWPQQTPNHVQAYGHSLSYSPALSMQTDPYSLPQPMQIHAVSSAYQKQGGTASRTSLQHHMDQKASQQPAIDFQVSDDAFARAFDDADKELRRRRASREPTEWQAAGHKRRAQDREVLTTGPTLTSTVETDESIAVAEAIINLDHQPKIGSDTIPPIEKWPASSRTPAKSHDSMSDRVKSDEMARIGENIIHSVGEDPRFRKSGFITLMRGLAEREIELKKNKFEPVIAQYVDQQEALVQSQA